MKMYHLKWMRGLALLGAMSVSSFAQEVYQVADYAIDPDYPPGIHEVGFTSYGDRLNGLFYSANGEGPHPAVVLLHGYPGNEKNLDIAQELRRQGWGVFFFHYRGAWGSEGEFSFLNAAADVGSALSHLRENAEKYRIDTSRLSIVGHSMGGQMTLAGASEDAGVKCAVTMAAAPLDDPGYNQMGEDYVAGFRQYADGLIMLNGHDGSNVIEQDVAFGEKYTYEKALEGLKGKKLLLIAATEDQAVPVSVHYDMVEKFTAANLEITTQLYKTDHSFSGFRLKLADKITGWMSTNCR